MPSPLAAAIATFEGFGKPGTVAARNNNPGNLTAGPLAVAKDAAGFAVYATPADGWADLDRQIALDAGRGLTLSEFIRKYAPPAENDTAAYLAYVSSATGAGPTTPLSALATSSSPAVDWTTIDDWPELAAADDQAGGSAALPWILTAGAAALVFLMLD